MWRLHTVRWSPPLPMAVLVAILLVLSASPAAAYHDHYMDHYYGPSTEPCVTVADDVEAECSVEATSYLSVPAEPAEGEEAEVNVEPRNTTEPATATHGVLPAEGTRRDAVETALEPTLSTRTTTDPLLTDAAEKERRVKTWGFDTAQTTGYHFRLACGWDLPLTRPICDVHDPEQASSLAYVRSLRDTTVQVATATARQGTTDAARDAVPGVHATVRVGDIHVAVAGPAVPGPGGPSAGNDAFVPLDTAGSGGATIATPHGGAPQADPPQPRRDAPVHTLGSSDAATRGFLGQATPGLHPWAGAGATLLAVAGAGTLVALAVLAYRHLERRALLANDTRRAIHDHLGDHPGATIAEAARTVDVAHETARYHLQVLAEHGIVVTERVGNRVHHFRTDEEPTTRRDRLLHVLDDHGAARDVYASLDENAGSSLKALSQHLPLSKSGIHWHLKRLQELGLVERRTTDGTPRYLARLG